MKCGENNVGIDKVRDAPVFHRLLVITLQICSVLLAVDKTPEEDYKFRKVYIYYRDILVTIEI